MTSSVPTALQRPKASETIAIPDPAVAPSIMAAAAAQAVAAIVATPMRARAGPVGERDHSKTAATQSDDTTAIHRYRISLPVVKSRMLAKANGIAASRIPMTFTTIPLQ